MSQSFRDNLVTEAEAAQFERDGYLIFEGALDRTRLDGLVAFTDSVEELYRDAQTRQTRHSRRPWGRRGGPAADLDALRPVPLGASVEFQNVLPDPRVLSLIDHDLLLPKVAGILGWNIFVYLASFVLSPPAQSAQTIAEHVALGWHQDSSQVNGDLPDNPRPRLSVKVAYFLSDVTHADGANMWIVPGSHLSNDPPPDAAERGIPLRVPAGTAVIFDRRLWHSASPNKSTTTRKVIFMGYAHRWLRPHDDMDLTALWPAASPLRRQLLGYAPDATSRYAPEDADVPLRALVDGAAVPVGTGSGSASS